MQADSQECSNCRKLFPVDRIDLHEAYCCRNIRKCKQCDQMVDIKDQEQHDKQNHDKKQCPTCNQMINPDNINTHIQTCPRKPMICKFCQNTWPLQQYNRHFQSCGARTKPCIICHKNIMLKDFQDHTGRCERRRQQRAEVSQDPIRDRRNHRNQRANGQRQRQNSTNNIRQQPIKSNSINKIIKPNSFKPSNIIGPQTIKAVVDPVPISVRMAMKNKQQPRVPLKNKN